MVREYKGAFSGEHGDGLVRSEWVAWQFGPRLTRAFEEIKDLFDPAGLMNPGQDRARHAHGRSHRCSAFRPGYRALPARHGARLVGVERQQRSGRATPLSAPGTGGDPAHGFAQGRRDVQQQRPLPQVRRRHDVPQLPRHARRAAPDARPRQHAAPGAVGPARRRCFASHAVREALDLCVSCKGCRRECPTGVDMAKMKIEFLHHWQQRARPRAAGARDRVPAALGAVGGARCRGCANLRDTRARPRAAGRAMVWACRRGARCRLAARHVLARRRACARARRRRRRRRAVRRHVHQLLRAGERARGARGAARRRLRASRSRARGRTMRSRDGRCAAAARSSPPGRVDEAKREARADGRRAGARTWSAARRSSASSRRACCRCATSSW